MALRLVEIILERGSSEEVYGLVQGNNLIDFRQIELPNDKVFVRILLEAKETEALLDSLEKYYTSRKDYRVLILPVEATLPRAEQEKERSDRIGREELYEDIKNAGRFTWVYLAMVALSTLVACIGLNQNNVPMIIGAMVIAPFLGPNMASALATTLGDLSLLRSAILTTFYGIITAAVLSAALGFLMNNPITDEMLSRTHVQFSDIAVALAAGCAGSLAFTSGVSVMLIGVMVSVSLLPPVVTFGMLIGSGYQTLSIGALLLFFVNLICVNLAGIAMFLVQGIYPLNLWEKDRAKKATFTAIPLWILLLAILTFLVYWLPVS